MRDKAWPFSELDKCLKLQPCCFVFLVDEVSRDFSRLYFRTFLLPDIGLKCTCILVVLLSSYLFLFGLDENIICVQISIELVDTSIGHHSVGKKRLSAWHPSWLLSPALC